MKIQIKFIVGLWVLVAQFCTTLVRGDLFNFPKESLLTTQQQEEVRNVFMDTMLDASRSFIVYLQNPSFKKMIKTSLGNSEVLKTMLLERFFKHSKKKDDKKIIADLLEGVSNGEDFLVIAGDRNDALFNGIIRETMRVFAGKYLRELDNQEAILNEIFKVLWDGITNKELVCNVDINFINAVRETIGGVGFDMVSSAYEIFNDTSGDFCDKIATVVSQLLCSEFNSAVDGNACCSCLQTTWGMTKKAFKKVLPVLPTLLQVALLIAKEVI